MENWKKQLKKIKLKTFLEIATFIGLIITLVFQYQQLSGAKSEINKLDKIVSNIQSNSDKLHEEEITRINKISDLIADNTEMYRTLLSIDDSDNKVVFDNFENLILSIRASNKAMISGEPKLLSAANNLQISLWNKMKVFRDWQVEINKITFEYQEKKKEYLLSVSSSEKTVNTLQKYNEELLKNLSVTEGKYSEVIKPHHKLLAKHRAELLRLLSIK